MYFLNVPPEGPLNFLQIKTNKLSISKMMNKKFKKNTGEVRKSV